MFAPLLSSSLLAASLLGADLPSQLQQAQTLLTQGRSVEATQHFARLRENPALTGRDRVTVESNFAIALLQSGRLEAAETSFAEAHRLLSAAPAAIFLDDDPLWPALWNAEAMLARQRGRWRQARDFHSRVEQFTRTGQPVLHGISLGNRAELERTLGDLPAAEAYARRALAVLDREQPHAARSRLAVLHILALVLQAQGRLDQAITALDEVWQARQQLDGPESRAAAVSEAALGAAYIAAGRLAHARQHLEAALPQLEQHPDLAAVWNNLAQVAKLEGRYADADPLYRRALSIWERTYGKRSREYGLGLANFGDFFLIQGKLLGAARLYADAERILASALGVAHASTQAAHLRRVETQAQGQKLTEIHSLRYRPGNR